MKAFLPLMLIFLVGCSSACEADVESSAGGVPSNPDYSDSGGDGYNPCGKTYKLVFQMPDGSKVIKEVPVYCTFWDPRRDEGDPAPRLIQPYVFIEDPADPNWQNEPYLLPPVTEKQIK